MLTTILGSSSLRQPPSLLILRSTDSQSALPLLRHLANKSSKDTSSPTATVLICVLYHPAQLLPESTSSEIIIVDWTRYIPNYDENEESLSHKLQKVLDDTRKDVSLDLIIDSVDALLDDIGSIANTYSTLLQFLTLLQQRPKPSRLVLHLQDDERLYPFLVQRSFSSAPFVQLIAHPPSLLNHVCRMYLIGPPPLSTVEKFWSVFLPASQRPHEVYRIIHGLGGMGWDGDEMVVEATIRGNFDGVRKDNNVNHFLEGWLITESLPCDLLELRNCKAIWAEKGTSRNGVDTTHGVLFNLNLTNRQQKSREKVPLPYAHEGIATITYDPDSADDIDGDDPDEDLNI